MKGRNVSAKEKALHDRIASIGCIACLEDGNAMPMVSIHHINGRTRKNAHKMVLPLCAAHHQDGTGAWDAIAVHPYKARFEEKYGKQEDLCSFAYELIGEKLEDWLD